MTLDAIRLAEVMHDTDWPEDHRWADCAIEGHREYYPRVAGAYATEYNRGTNGVPLATGAKR